MGALLRGAVDRKQSAPLLPAALGAIADGPVGFLDAGEDEGYSCPLYGGCGVYRTSDRCRAGNFRVKVFRGVNWQTPATDGTSLRVQPLCTGGARGSERVCDIQWGCGGNENEYLGIFGSTFI